MKLVSACQQISNEQPSSGLTTEINEAEVEYEYWDVECRLSKPALYKVLYATCLLQGAITSTLTVPFNLDRYEPKVNAYNLAYLRIRLKPGLKDRWEALSGYTLRKPPTVHVN